MHYCLTYVAAVRLADLSPVPSLIPFALLRCGSGRGHTDRALPMHSLAHPPVKPVLTSDMVVGPAQSGDIIHMQSNLTRSYAAF